MTVRLAVAAATLSAVLCGQTPQTQPPTSPTIKQSPAAQTTPSPVPPPSTSNEKAPVPVRSMDLNALDRTADPCTDFYQFACGNWVKNNPIPSDQARWGRFNELAEQNNWVLRGILEKAAAEKSSRDATTQKIGDLYAACMDTGAANKKGITPIKPDLDRIAAIKSSQEIMPVVIDLHNRGEATLFRFGSGQDLKDATEVIAQMFQGGLGLPDREYYLSDQKRFVEFRDAYDKTIVKMLTLAGWQQPQAEDAAKRILALETKLAQASMDRTEMRDPAKRYHRMTQQEASALAPNLSLTRYFEGVHTPANSAVNVGQPDFFKAASELINTTPVDDWKAYLTWSVLRRNADFLSDDFVNANFDLYGKTLRGQAEIQPRWKRCVSTVNRQIGEALGEEYVKVAFGPEAKQRMDQLVANLEAALGEDIQSLDWMSAATKQQAEVKLKA
ncbi:MAG: M13 family peptidase, partial [Acidobacteriales bacterium]|nr:M13 family peptidase [Terriglobales bacterium]